MDQNLKQNFDLNSATIGVGLAEASKLLRMASANPAAVQKSSILKKQCIKKQQK